MASTTPIEYALNDLVWAKMKGFSPWPGRIAEPPTELKKIQKKNIPTQCIFFYGTNNYAWIEEANIKPYETHKEQLIKSCKSASFKEAVGQIEAYIKDPELFNAQFNVVVNDSSASASQDTDADFNKLRENDSLDESAASVKSTASSAPATPANSSGKRRSSNKKKAEKPKTKANSVKPSEEVEDEDGTSSQPPTKKKRKSSTTERTPTRRYSIHNDNTVTNDVDAQKYSQSSVSSSSSRRYAPISHLLNRPMAVERPEIEEIDMTEVSHALEQKNIEPSNLKFGFLGLGIMGSGIVKNLINSGHKVIVWNRTYSKCVKFADAGAQVAHTPSDVVDAADITFSCVSDPQAAKDMVFGNCGVLQATTVSDSKGYVEMTGIDAETSQDIADAILSKGGRYLEAQIQGSKMQAEEGTLIILAAGERSLFEECQSCFKAMGRNSFYLGEVGNASKMNLVLQMMAGVTLAALAEAMALADRAGLQQKDVMEVLELTNLASRMIIEKGTSIIKGEFPPHHPLQHMQKDLKLALSMADSLEQPLPLAASSNEVFKHAKRLGYAEHDSSAVYVRARF